MARITLSTSSNFMTTNENIVTPRAEETSIVEAVLEVVDAGQRVVVDRVNLLRSDALQTVARVQRQLFVWAVLVVLFGTAWIAFSAAMVMLLARYVSWVNVGFIIAGANGGLALGLLGWTSSQQVVRRNAEEAK
jgi:hypothetical protein